LITTDYIIDYIIVRSYNYIMLAFA